MRFRRVDFSKYSSIRVGETLDVLVLESFDAPTDRTVVGAANNLIVGPEAPALMLLGKTFDYIREADGQLVVGAATPGGRVVSYCKKHDIGGFEFMAHLPGTVGGMLKMNAGLKRWEIFDRLVSVRTGEAELPKARIDHGYRHCGLEAVIFEARFEIERGFSAERVELFRSMRANQPAEPSAGSFFKNPPGDYAGRLLEQVGLRGYRIGDMAFSAMHANFLVNLGGGRFDDAMALVQLAQRRVFEAEGIWLENEVTVLDREYHEIITQLP